MHEKRIKGNLPEPLYRILCEVSGGSTGYRTAYLKDQGEEVWLPRAEAEQRCCELDERANGNQYRTADFRYTVED